jgi:hypothetical protein
MVSSNLYYLYSLGFIIEKGAKGIDDVKYIKIFPQLNTSDIKKIFVF